MTEYELYHHGIKGQKWGVRRTAAQLGHRVAGAASKTGKVLLRGASKAGKATGKFVKKEAGVAKKAAVTKIKQTHAENKEKRYYAKLHKKKLSQMTDKEIKDLTDRVKKEATLKDAKYESRVQNARKFYQNVAKQPVNTFLATYSGKAIEKAFKDDKKEDSGNNKQSNKNQNKKNDDVTINFEIDSGSSMSKKKPRKGTANTFNNPVIIRHGGN